MKIGVGIVFAVAIVSLLASSASAYMLDFQIDNSTYMCGDVVHGTLKVSHFAGEDTDPNRNFRVNLFTPGVTVNGALSCTFDREGRVVPNTGGCNGFGIGLVEPGLIKTGTTRAQGAGFTDVGADSDFTGYEGPVEPNGGESKTYATADTPVGDGIYNVWIDTGAYVDPNAGTCYLGTYGVRAHTITYWGEEMSSYRAYDVYMVSNLTDSGDSNDESAETQSESSSSSSSSSSGSRRIVNLDSNDVEVTSLSNSEESIAVPDLAVEVSEKSSSVGLLAFMVVILAGIVLAVYMRMRN